MDQFVNYLICQKTDNVATKNSTDPFVATIEEKTVAYLALCIMAVLPIIVGSFRSIHTLKKQLQTADHSQTMSTKDVAMFPFIASFALLSIYIVFKIFSKEYVNFLLTLYFFILGIVALTHVISPILNRIFSSSYNQTYSLQFTQRSDSDRTSLIDFEFTTLDVFALIFSALFGSWYLWKKHWIANNILGLAFSINGIEILQLNTVVNGCILLGGLFIYDIFWVFGTDVMVTVAKSFEAPIKLIFPQDFLLRGVFGTHFAMLGLGDIVVPGIFIALLLRYDYSLKRKSYFYFYTCLFSYIIGLTITVVVLTIFRHAQPALLYLVPCCILTPLTLALLRGDLKTMFAYTDNPTVVEGDKKSD